MTDSDCAPAADGYGPACNRMGELHVCGLVESPEEGFLVSTIAQRLTIWFTSSHQQVHAQARAMVRMVREHDEEEGDGR